VERLEADLNEARKGVPAAEAGLQEAQAALNEALAAE